MRIVCTHCQTGYQVDISEVKPEGIEFKCIKCNNFFLVTRKNIDRHKLGVRNKPNKLQISN